MASSGTVTLTIDMRYKPPRPRETVVVAGHAKMKNSAVIEAQDLELRTIKSFVATPYAPIPSSAGTFYEGPTQLYGSVAIPGSLMNAVTLAALKGSMSIPRGTTHLGTRAAGTVQFGFLAVGA